MKALQFNATIPGFIAAKSLKPIFGNRVFYQGPARTIKMVDIPEPELPSPDWVKLKTIYCGFCGSDLNLILLNESPTASPFGSFPCIVGHEIFAEVVKTGADVDGYKPGDRVVVNPILGCEIRGIDPMCPSCRAGRNGSCENFAKGDLPAGILLGITRSLPGGFAQYLVAHKSQLYKIPEGLDGESAVMTEPLAVGLQAVFDNLPLEGENALVIGGGVIGNLVIQSIRALAPDCRISLIEPSPQASELALQAGAEHIIPPGKIFEELPRITGASVYKPLVGMKISTGGFNRIYDTVGHAQTLNLSMRVLAPLGTLSIIGIGGDVKLDLTPLWLKLQKIQGVSTYGMVIWKGAHRHVFDIALELMNAGKIKANALVTHKFKIEDYRDMIEVNLNKGKHKAVKSVVTYGHL